VDDDGLITQMTASGGPHAETAEWDVTNSDGLDSA
jgi:hypothetical protein